MAHLVGYYVCVCCFFVFCAVSKTIRCSQVSPISISKNENYELCISAGFFAMTGKKSSSRLSDGYTINYDWKKKLRPEKKKFQSSVWRVVLLWFWRLRPEKKSSSRLSGGLSVFGSGDYDRKKKSSSRH